MFLNLSSYLGWYVFAEIPRLIEELGSIAQQLKKAGNIRLSQDCDRRPTSAKDVSAFSWIAKYFFEMF